MESNIEWRTVKFDNDNYEVSNTGLVRNKATGKLLKQQESDMRYFVTLSNGLYKKRCRVHRLVAEAFLPNPDNLPVVNHKDTNSLNNNLSNLEWCTYQYNAEHGMGRPVVLRDCYIDNELEFPSITKAAEFLGVKPGSVHYYITNRIASPTGYWIRFKEIHNGKQTTMQ